MPTSLFRIPHHILTLCFALASVTSVCYASQVVTAQSKTQINEALRRELSAMLDVDQAIRQKQIAAGWKDRLLNEEQKKIDVRNTARLREIFKQHGFPGNSLVGKDGAFAAYMIIIHSPSLELKREALPHVEKGLAKGELPPVAVAGLTDKVLVTEGKPQRYGTHYDFRDGLMVMAEVEAASRLDSRRAELGLEPIAEYAQNLADMNKMPAVVGKRVFRPKP